MEKSIVLVVEDLAEERFRAMESAKGFNFKLIFAENLEDGERLLEKFKEKIFGVVTDLHYQSRVGWAKDKESPNGLAMIALCVDRGVRVAVCTDADHHCISYLSYPVEIFESHKNYGYSNIPVSTGKNWSESFKMMLNIIRKVSI